MANTYNILLADDDESNQLLLENFLCKEGHSVAVVSNGQEAINELDKIAYDICILDMQMPAVSGIDVLKMYQQKNPRSHLSFIVLSGDESTNTVNQCLAAGADLYLIKPITRPKLIEAINSVCGTEQSSVVDDEISNEKKDTCIDISRLQSVNDQEFLNEFIRLFQDSADKFIKTLSLSLENDIDAFKQAAHSLKGLSGNIGAARLREITSLAENITNEEYAISAKNHYQDISKELLEIRNELKKYPR